VRRPGRQLTGEEAALWKRVTQSVTPINGRMAAGVADRGSGAERSAAPQPNSRRSAEAECAPPRLATGSPTRAREERRALDRDGLDAGWDRRLSRGLVPPDFTLDLHGSTLDAAHARLEHGLTLALAQGARLVLLITGRHRPSDDRASRGAIRRKFLDWLAAGPHASRIAAVRPAHQRHGGAGAVYIVLRKPR
jgi:DNA-nicking Smr family endonuclease